MSVAKLHDRRSLSARITRDDIKTPYDLGSPVKRIFCADGFNISVQAGRASYCRPRDNVGPWLEVELGYPSASLPEAFDEYCDDDSRATVWGYVPIDMVVALINEHGGEVEP